MRKQSVNRYKEQMLQVQLEIQEDLFRTLSLQIHDNVGQQLSLSKLYLKSMEPCLGAQTKEQVENVRRLIGDCISDLRELAVIFSPDMIRQSGLVGTLRKQVSVIRKTGHLQVDMSVEPNLGEPSNDVCIVVFRMIQECLFNVLSNALATRMEIKLYSTSQYWCADIADNRKKEKPQFKGVPVSLEKKGKLIGAHVYSRYEPGKGLCYKICIPLNKKKND